MICAAGPAAFEGPTAVACGATRRRSLPHLGDILQLPYFYYTDAVANKGTGLGPGTRLLHAGGLDEDKSADAFLGLDKGPIAIHIAPTYIFPVVGEGAGVQKMTGTGHLVDPFAHLPRLAYEIFMA